MQVSLLIKPLFTFPLIKVLNILKYFNENQSITVFVMAFMNRWEFVLNAL